MNLAKSFRTSLLQSGNQRFHIFNHKSNMPDTERICQRLLKTVASVGV